MCERRDSDDSVEYPVSWRAPVMHCTSTDSKDGNGLDPFSFDERRSLYSLHSKNNDDFCPPTFV